MDPLKESDQLRAKDSLPIRSVLSGAHNCNVGSYPARHLDGE